MRRKSSSVRQNEIANIARDLIIHEGVQGVTIKNIAKKSKISEAAIYRHFKDKNAILTMVINAFQAQLMQAITVSAQANKNSLERLKEIMKTHMIFTEKKKGMLFALTAESIYFNDDRLRRRILGVIEQYKAKIKTILADAKKEGVLREDVNLDAVSLAFFGLIQAAIVQFALTNYTVAPITKFQTLWNIFLKGIESKKYSKERVYAR